MIHKPDTDELEEAKELAREGVERGEKVLPKEKELKIGFGWNGDDFVKEKMGGTRGMAYSPVYLKVEFNSRVDEWKENVVASAVHEYAHTYFYEKKAMDSDDEMPMWMYILNEALSQNTTARLVPEVSNPWRTKQSKEEIADYWDKIKEEELDRTYSFPDPLFIDRSEGGYPNWLGYSLAYLIGKKLREDGVELKEFPELEREDVVEAGNKLFG
ncbi:MAG: DUF2268 domain-containing putative Zn-dependent protease [Candidatus Nanohalobium sp.]